MDTMRFNGLPRCPQGCVQRATFLFGKVVSSVVCDEVDDRPIGSRRGLIEDEAAVFEASTERAHAATVGR